MRRFVLPCRAGELLGIIRHSHLQNRFISALPDEADDLRRIYQKGSQALAEFRELTEEFLSCLAEPTGGYCAAGLVDTLPALRELSDDGRKQLKASIASAYAEQFQPMSRAAAIRSAYDTLLKLHGAFFDKVEATPSEIEQLRDGAVALYQLVRDLPRGIWLWPQQEASK